MGLSFLQDLIPLASNIFGQMQSNKAINKYNVPTAAEQQSQALYAALADPNSPLVAQFAKQAHDTNVANFLTQLRGMQNADRRQQALGRNPTFFNPERADEALSFLTSRGLPQMDQLATQEARNRILQAASGIQTNQAPQIQRNNVSMLQGVSNAAYNSTVPQSIMNIFSKQQIPQPSGLTTNGYGSGLPLMDAGTINWNQPQYNQMRY